MDISKDRATNIWWNFLLSYKTGPRGRLILCRKASSLQNMRSIQGPFFYVVYGTCLVVYMIFFWSHSLSKLKSVQPKINSTSSNSSIIIDIRPNKNYLLLYRLLSLSLSVYTHSTTDNACFQCPRAPSSSTILSNWRSVNCNPDCFITLENFQSLIVMSAAVSLCHKLSFISLKNKSRRKK